MTVGAGDLQPVKRACTAQWNLLETTVSVFKNIKEWRARKQSRSQEKKCFEWRYCLPQNHYILPNCAWEILLRHKSMWMMCPFSAKHTNCTAVSVSWKLVNWVDALMGRFSLAAIIWGFYGFGNQSATSWFLFCAERPCLNNLSGFCYANSHIALAKFKMRHICLKCKKKTKTRNHAVESFLDSPPLEAQ